MPKMKPKSYVIPFYKSVRKVGAGILVLATIFVPMLVLFVYRDTFNDYGQILMFVFSVFLSFMSGFWFIRIIDSQRGDGS